jgi:hypothetical protein
MQFVLIIMRRNNTLFQKHVPMKLLEVSLSCLHTSFMFSEDQKELKFENINEIMCLRHKLDKVTSKLKEKHQIHVNLECIKIINQ